MESPSKKTSFFKVTTWTVLWSTKRSLQQFARE
uniref:Uncharacterized protein n=1 Tax=Rhizophora mucronata TaxID=61149 RepID=A0A2P2ND46_RHIMU